MKLPRLAAPTWKTFSLAAIVASALGFGGYAVAQYTVPILGVTIQPSDAFADIQLGAPSASGVYATAKQLRSWIFNQNSLHAAPPTLTETTSICGGNTAAVNGTDASGQVTEGTSASTSCVINYGTAYASAPECFVSLNGVADTSLKCSTNTTAMTVTQTSASNNVLNYETVGLPGG